MLGPIESTVDLSSPLRDGSVSLRLISLTVWSFGERRHVPSHLHGDFLGQDILQTFEFNLYRQSFVYQSKDQIKTL